LAIYRSCMYAFESCGKGVTYLQRKVKARVWLSLNKVKLN